MTDQKPPNAPVDVVRDGALKIAIWENQGENGPYLSVSLSKTYEKAGKLHDGNSFSGSDLLRLAELARDAYGSVKYLRSQMAQVAHPEGAGAPTP